MILIMCCGAVKFLIFGCRHRLGKFIFLGLRAGLRYFSGPAGLVKILIIGRVKIYCGLVNDTYHRLRTG